MTRSAELDALVRGLERLLAALHNDPDSGWVATFEARLAEARSLAQADASTEDLTALARAVLSCFRGGMGSFNDYAPVYFDQVSGSWRVIPGLEEESALAHEVFERAAALRTVGSHESL